MNESNLGETCSIVLLRDYSDDRYRPFRILKPLTFGAAAALYRAEIAALGPAPPFPTAAFFFSLRDAGSAEAYEENRFERARRELSGANFISWLAANGYIEDMPIPDIDCDRFAEGYGLDSPNGVLEFRPETEGDGT